MCCSGIITSSVPLMVPSVSLHNNTIICLGFLPRSVWNKQTRIRSPSPEPSPSPCQILWHPPPPPPALWDHPRTPPSLGNRCRGGHRLAEPWDWDSSWDPLPLFRGLPQKPSFLLSCPWAGPAAEAARASVYSYPRNPILTTKAPTLGRCGV